jgi:hypothetical protein
MATQPIHDALDDLIGTVKTFGDYGPMYQVTGAAPASADGKPKVQIIVIESGETLDYDLAAVLADPVKP